MANALAASLSVWINVEEGLLQQVSIVQWPAHNVTSCLDKSLKTLEPGKLAGREAVAECKCRLKRRVLLCQDFICTQGHFYRAQAKVCSVAALVIH
jgi:hypothetical protein